MTKIFQISLILVAIVVSNSRGENEDARENITSGNKTELFDFVTTEPKRILKVQGSLSFGEVPVAEQKVLKIRLKNLGNSTLKIKGIRFSRKTGCKGNWTGKLRPGRSKKIPISFTPSAAKEYSGILTVLSNKTRGKNTLSISGKGLEVISNKGYVFHEVFTAENHQGLSGEGYTTSEGVGVFELNWADYPGITFHQIISKKVESIPESVDSTMLMAFDDRSPLNAAGIPSAIFMEEGYFIAFGNFNPTSGEMDATVFQTTHGDPSGVELGRFKVNVFSQPDDGALAGNVSTYAQATSETDPIVKYAVKNALNYTSLGLKNANGISSKTAVEFVLKKTISSVSLANKLAFKNEAVDIALTGYNLYSCVAGTAAVAGSIAAGPATVGTSWLATGVLASSTIISCADAYKGVSSAVDTYYDHQDKNAAIAALQEETEKVIIVQAKIPELILEIGNVVSSDPVFADVPLPDYRPNSGNGPFLTEFYWAISGFETVVNNANQEPLSEEDRTTVNSAIQQLEGYKSEYNQMLDTLITVSGSYVGYCQNGISHSYDLHESLSIWQSALLEYQGKSRF